jgi:hypothetical protein
MDQIRAFAAEDVASVARLFQTTFVDHRRNPPASLQVRLADVFLRHPWYDSELASRVYVSPAGAVRGFIGVLPLCVAFRGKTLRAGVAGALMVERPDENPLAGARLLRSFANGPQELSISESANRRSETMWQRLGGRVLPFESMDWLRVLHPVGLALAFAAERFAPARLLRPLGSLIDRAAQRTRGNPLRLDKKPSPGAHDVEASDELLLREIPQFAASYAIRPDWDAASLQWMLAQAQTKGRRGPVFRRMVYGANEAALGCYIYYGRPSGIAWVLQILARPEYIDAVVENLLAHAFRNGCAGVRGRTHPRLMNALLRQGCMFFHRSSTVVHTADRELLDAIHSGDALLTGLAGEAWSPLVGDTFA